MMVCNLGSIGGRNFVLTLFLTEAALGQGPIGRGSAFTPSEESDLTEAGNLGGARSNFKELSVMPV